MVLHASRWQRDGCMISVRDVGVDFGGAQETIYTCAIQCNGHFYDSEACRYKIQLNSIITILFLITAKRLKSHIYN